MFWPVVFQLSWTYFFFFPRGALISFQENIPMKLPLTYRNIISNSILYVSVITAWCHQEKFLNSFYEVVKSTLQVFTFAGLVPGNGRPANGIYLWHSNTHSFLKAVLFMGLVTGLQMGPSTKAECWVQLIFSQWRAMANTVLLQCVTLESVSILSENWVYWM